MFAGYARPARRGREELPRRWAPTRTSETSAGIRPRARIADRVMTDHVVDDDPSRSGRWMSLSSRRRGLSNGHRWSPAPFQRRTAPTPVVDRGRAKRVSAGCPLVTAGALDRSDPSPEPASAAILAVAVGSPCCEQKFAPGPRIAIRGTRPDPSEVIRPAAQAATALGRRLGRAGELASRQCGCSLAERHAPGRLCQRQPLCIVRGYSSFSRSETIPAPQTPRVPRGSPRRVSFQPYWALMFHMYLPVRVPSLSTGV